MPTRGLARLACLAAAVVFIPLAALPAIATGSNPPWEPDPNAVGTLSFFDASGHPVTGGADLSHLFDYALASSNDPSTKPGNIANLEFSNPTPGEDPGLWTSSADESSNFPNGSAPGALGAATAPLVTLDSEGANLQAAAGGFTKNTVAGYVDAYEIRVYTTGPNGAGTTGSKYWDADVTVNFTAGTWIETYPTAGTSGIATTATIAVTPATSAKQGASVTVTATEVATDTSHPSGTMEIDDGNQVLGTGAVNSSGQFSVTKTTLLPGHQSLTAIFTSTAVGYNGSTSAAKSYLINPVAKKPTISGTVQAGKKVTCKEATTSGETYTTVWDASGKKVGTGNTFTVPGSAVGKSLTCTATVKVSGGTPSSATSAGKKVAEGAALKATKKPKLSGTGKVGKTEKVSSGTWSPRASSYSYQWYLGSKKIKGATKSSLTLKASEKGKTITCRVTAHKTGFASGTATSKGVKVS